MVDAAALTGGRAGLDDVLDPLEQVFVDECLVPPVDLLAFVGDDAEVVPVAEHERQFVDRYLLGGVHRGWSGSQAAVVQLVGQVGEGVVTAGVELEAEADEVGACRVGCDGADLAAFGAVEDVEVAQGCARPRVPPFLAFWPIL